MRTTPNPIKDHLGHVSLHDKNSISEYTEAEFLEIARDVCTANFKPEELCRLAAREFVRLSEHPDGTDIIFYPPKGSAHDPEAIINKIKEWRAANGLPGFKAS